jgi:hypothetical protein
MISMGVEYTYKGNKIGFISDSGKRFTAFKKTNTVEPEHDCVFRMYNSLGFEDEIITDLITKGVEEIVIILKNEIEGTEEFFFTLPMDWKVGAKSYFHKDFGVQKHLDLETLRRLTKERCEHV